MFESNYLGTQTQLKMPGDLVLGGAGKGVVLKSPGGMCYVTTVSDTGVLGTAPTACP
jgi:hypothetical protein